MSEQDHVTHQRPLRSRGSVPTDGRLDPAPVEAVSAHRNAASSAGVPDPGAHRTRPRLGPLTDLEGVGPARAEALASLGLRDVGDLLFLMPLGMSQGASTGTIASALQRIGSEATVEGTVEKTSLQRFGKRSTFRVTVRDDTGSIVALFYNQPWMQKRFTVGDRVTLRGKVLVRKELALHSPKIGSSAKPLPSAGELTPTYPAAEGVSSAVVAKLVRIALERCTEEIQDPIDARALARFGVPPLAQAVRDLHAPSSMEAFLAARRRMGLETLLELSARLQERRAQAASGHALRVVVDDATDTQIRARFPFALTPAQARVADELRADLSRAQPMRRLLQGDVGSGKTALGVYAAMLVARGGGQTAFLAPTELLAEQHYDGLRALLSRAGLKSVLLTGSLKAGERRNVLAQLSSGKADVAFGTHALFSDDVTYARLGLCVIDEQHRFGVAQRGELLEKGRDVHALLMTATPIPRTLALSIYGDLDTSVLDERPPGRGPLSTRWVRGTDKRKIESFLIERVESGERLYWVVPRIGEADEESLAAAKGDAITAEARHERLKKSRLAAHGIELVHGRIARDERAARIERFRRGEARTLVATTVIEVGVDVPEATVMVIEGAERLGLAQLHQLRGRVGRGQRPSHCLLFGAASGSARFEVLVRTHDGFEIAEEDLRARGMGDLAGLRQAGENAEGLADIAADVDLFLAARAIVAEDPRAFEHYKALARARARTIAP
jgi:ATP-dependent DNA helicase RecG